jgi:hypothetical protein
MMKGIRGNSMVDSTYYRAARLATMSLIMLKLRRIHRNYAVSITRNPRTPLALSTTVCSMVTKIEHPIFTLYLRTLCFPKRVHAVEFGAFSPLVR